MTTFARTLQAEALKWRRSALARLVFILPLLFVVIDFVAFERRGLELRSLTPFMRATLEANLGRVVVGVWAGFFHPLMLALLPALCFRPEHRDKTWRHLGTMPVSRGQYFLAKAVSVLGLSGFMLVQVGLLLFLEHKVLGALNPLLALPFKGRPLIRILAWLWLSSLPLLAIYLWICDRISSMAVPVVFGLAGLMLTIALTGQELPQPWRRDLIPWVLPYAAAEQVIHVGVKQQEVHAAGAYFQPEANVLRLPSGRRVKVTANAAEEDIFPAPPPTPAWVLATFSVIAGGTLLFLGWLDAGHERV